MLRIRLADIGDLPFASSVCRGKVLGTKILCQMLAYGFECSFLDVWCCINEEDNIVALISKFEDSITVDGDINDGDFETLKTFFDMLGFGNLCCPSSYAERLGYKETIVKKAYEYTESGKEAIIDDLNENCYKAAYSLICNNIPDSFSDSKDALYAFLSDFTFRKRRKLARIKGYVQNDKVYSCALTSSETEVSAIISGVACDINARNTGLGRKTVLSLADELKSEGKEVYVIALNEKAEGFYNHIGFEFKEKISFVER